MYASRGATAELREAILNRREAAPMHVSPWRAGFVPAHSLYPAVSSRSRDLSSRRQAGPRQNGDANLCSGAMQRWRMEPSSLPYLQFRQHGTVFRLIFLRGPSKRCGSKLERRSGEGQ
jgi:hypothetical protein